MVNANLTELLRITTHLAIGAGSTLGRFHHHSAHHHHH